MVSKLILAVVFLGLTLDVMIHLIKQMKKTGEWRINYDILATFLLTIMLIMSYFTYAFRSDIEISVLISLWVMLPLYSLLRCLVKTE
jgi:hypothetical protein